MTVCRGNNATTFSFLFPGSSRCLFARISLRPAVDGTMNSAVGGVDKRPLLLLLLRYTRQPPTRPLQTWGGGIRRRRLTSPLHLHIVGRRGISGLPFEFGQKWRASARNEQDKRGRAGEQLPSVPASTTFSRHKIIDCVTTRLEKRPASLSLLLSLID